MFSPVYVVVEYACGQPAVPSGNRFPISDLSSGTAPVILEYRVFSPHSPFVPDWQAEWQQNDALGRAFFPRGNGQGTLFLPQYKGQWAISFRNCLTA